MLQGQLHRLTLAVDSELAEDGLEVVADGRIADTVGRVVPEHNALCLAGRADTNVLGKNEANGRRALFRDITHQMQYETYVELVLHAATRLPPS